MYLKESIALAVILWVPAIVVLVVFEWALGKWRKR